jgi:NRPS condensation-like uncharacterized protein
MSPPHPSTPADGGQPPTGEPQGRSASRPLSRLRTRPEGANGGHVPTAAEPLSLYRALEASDRFHRDSLVGGIFHHGKISFREVSPTDSLHVILDGDRVSVHVDDVSPLRCGSDGSFRYAWGRVVAHNLASGVSDVGRRMRGLQGQQRCNLHCEAVWVDDEQITDVSSLLEELHVDPYAEEPAPPDRVRVPFSLIDEAIHLLDTEAAPWSIQLEVKVTGRLDESRLRDAVVRALASHPMARARKEASRRSMHRDNWVIQPGTDVDPLRVVECADDTALAAIRAELQSMAVPLAESPPLRARLARHPDGDVLMLNVNHAAMDGFGALRVLQSVARAYTGSPDPPPAVDLLEARDLPVRLVSGADAPTRLRRSLALAEKLRDLVAPPARLAADGASQDAGYGFHHVALPAGTTAAIVGLDHDGTTNDVLLAALHLAIAGWNEEHDTPCSRVGVLVPANLRPAEWRTDMAANFSLPARISSTRASRRTPRAALTALTTQTRRKKKTGMGTAILQVLGRSHTLPIWAKQVMVMMLPLTGNRLVDSAMLSNLGSLPDPPTFGTEAGDTVEMWFSPPARMPLGLAVGAATVAGRLHLAFRYRLRLFDADAAGRFADRYLSELDRVVASVKGPRPFGP